MTSSRRIRLRRFAGAIAAVAMAAGGAVVMAPAGAVQIGAQGVLHLDDAFGYDGHCTEADSNGTTFVIDFQELDGNDGRPAETIVRCAPTPGNEPVIRNGLVAMLDAGIVPAGTQRWGDDIDSDPPYLGFVCRIEGRPAADEPLELETGGAGTPTTTYYEPCGDTPPALAYWSYWHADGQGQDWQYSQMGIMNRNVVPGGFEGWSFSLNTHYTGDDNDNPSPRIDPIHPVDDDPEITFEVSATQIELGDSITLTWDFGEADYLYASGSWNQRRLSADTETVTPAAAGTHIYRLRSSGLDPEVQRAVTVVVADPAEPGRPTGGHANAARQTAGWLVGEMGPEGQMPGPGLGTDWGVTIDTLWALHAAGTGERAARAILREVDANAGAYMGMDLYDDPEVRNGGSTAKILLAAVVGGDDPRFFGQSTFTESDDKYDMRSETLDLIATEGPQIGRLKDRGTPLDNTNIFSQSLAVIGLARSGGVPEEAVEFLMSQQCSAGYFRMFYNDERSCDTATGGNAPDGDGTAIGLSALMTARDHGLGGELAAEVDEAIDRGLDWLLDVQHDDGSFGGGVSTEAPNSNSTGLIAQTLYAGYENAEGARAAELFAAYEKAADWVLTLHVNRATAGGTPLFADLGAIAYNPAAFAAGRSEGIGTGAGLRDQWRRASSQAIFALAPVPFSRLGETDLTGDPDVQNRPDRTGEPGGSGAGLGSPSPPPGSPGTRTVRVPTVSQAEPGSDTPSGRLAAYLASVLTDGNRVEVEIGEDVFVDYDLTADLVLALHALGEQAQAIDEATAFLLNSASVGHYARGEAWEDGAAQYADALATLVTVGRLWQTTGRAPDESVQRVNRLARELSGLMDEDGLFHDTGRYADVSESTERHALASTALVAARLDGRAEPAIAALLARQCADGTFPRHMAAGDCETGDLVSTAVAARAINAGAAVTPSAEPGQDIATVAWTSTMTPTTFAHQPPRSWDAARAEALEAAGRAMHQRLDASGLVFDEDTLDRSATVAVAPARQMLGLDAHATANALAALQHVDGGFAEDVEAEAADVELSIAAAEAVAARSWTGSFDSPVVPVVSLPLDLTAWSDSDPLGAPQSLSAWWWIVAACAVILTAIGAFAASRRFARTSPAGVTP